VAGVATRWAGIDEAGYGPNLGPMVMTAVVAETADDRPPDLWADLAETIDRAGGRPDRLWVDDSKLLYRGGVGRDRLVSACLALVASLGEDLPRTFGGLLNALGAGSLDDVELSPWLDGVDPPVHVPVNAAGLEFLTASRPFEGAAWRVAEVRSAVLGPRAFNEGLARPGWNKASVHFGVFAGLLGRLWERAADGVETRVLGDKHGGRHYYLGPLAAAFPDARIDRGVEGPDLSRYTLRAPGRRLVLSLRPRADREDGLVALASVVSKTVRELWMDAFNAHWVARFPGLRPTAGYPGDAARFREAIEPVCRHRGLSPDEWWRAR